METIWHFLKILGLIVSVVGFIFCGFRLKQAKGSSRFNNLSADFGGGSFTNAVTSGFKEIMWWLAVVFFLVTGIICLFSLNQSKTNLNNSEESEKILKNSVSDDKLSSQQQTISADKSQPVEVIDNKVTHSNNTISNESKLIEEPEKVFTKEEVEQLEKEKQYSGDDPIVRNRLGLPPKP